MTGQWPETIDVAKRDVNESNNQSVRRGRTGAHAAGAE